jgi:hypothetical protein
MFKILIIKLPAGQKIKIKNIGPEWKKRPLVTQAGSSYDDYEVWINPNVYDGDGVGIPERQYYCLNEKDNIAIKRKSMAGSMFHEFTHCLHHIEDAEKYIAYSDLNSLPKYDGKDNPWSDKEELRTITGYNDNVYDTICDNCFEIYEAVSSKKPDSLQVTYNLRVGHIGYRSDLPDKDKENIEELQKYITFNKKVVEHWKGYLISSKV